MIASLLIAAALALGAAPPALEGRWLRPAEFDGAEPVVVIAAWALWNAPSLAEMPRLARLHRDYPRSELVVVGLIKPDPGDPDEPKGSDPDPIERIRLAVERKGERLPYAVLVDEDTTTRHWFSRCADATVTRHPAPAIVLDRSGAIVWCGPQSLLDAVVPKVIAGEWVPERDAARLASLEAEFRAILLDAMRSPEETPGRLAAFRERAPDHIPHVACRTIAVLVNSGDRAAGEALAHELIERFRRERDYSQLLQVAGYLRGGDVDTPASSRALVLEAVRTAVELSDRREPEPLLHLADTEFTYGDRALAIAAAREALALVDTESSRRFIRSMLVGFGVDPNE